MANFPSITDLPLIDDWEEKAAMDSTLRSTAEAGYVQTRPRFTRIPEKYHIVYPRVSETDKGLIKTFERTTVRMGADSFNYTLPDATVKVVRFLGEVSYRRADGLRWRIEFDLEEL